MNLKKIFQAFPAPKFLDIPYAGIMISDSYVRCVSFVKKNGIHHLDKYTERPIKPGSVVDGQINNTEELVSILSEIKKDLNLKFVKISLPEEKAYLFTAKIPAVGEDEIKSAIESKMEENVPVSPSELTFDYKLFERPEKDLIDVVVSALPIKIIDSYVDIATRSNLSLISLEIESQAVTRAIVPANNNNTSLIINFSKDKFGLYVSTSRVVRFTSTIQTRGESSNNPAFLMQEVKRLYTYWHTLKENVGKPERQISQIYICGEGADDSLVSFVATHSKTPTELANVWLNAFDINKNVPEIPFNDSLKYAGAIGLAIPSKILV
ncbi:MAG TPA: pilus assembly protein PilM [Parcubacteria group bacterium]|jgi:Tfp pilus assembly PilM family ATPase|nr:pilus assembly protein PilM [Parcubacteria group bacterium]